MERVQKFIAQSGYCSRRKAEELIEQQRVKVNGKTIILGDHATKEDVIEIDDERIKTTPESPVYIIMNKPKGVITSNNDEFNRKTVFDLLENTLQSYRLFSVGRLDKDTTGLLILTNDGEFSQKIIHPSSKIAKTYHVWVDKRLSEKEKKRLERGVVIDGVKLAPCIIRDHKSYYLVKIWEGRKRQIRKMFEEVGSEVKELKRVKIGELSLEKLSLKPGKYNKMPKEFLEKTIIK